VNAKEYTPDAWREAVWALAVVDHPKARAAARILLNPKARVDLQITGCHCVSLWRDKAAVDELIALLQTGNQAIRRAAAEALGRIGDPKCIPTILELLADVKNDRILDHSLTYALIEIGNAKATREGLKNPSPLVRRATLPALDAMPGKALTAEDVLKELDAKEAELRDTAWWVAGKHPDWGHAIADTIRARFHAIKNDQYWELIYKVVPLAKSKPVQTVLSEITLEAKGHQLSGPNRNPPENCAVWAADAAFISMQLANLKETPECWFSAIEKVLEDSEFDRPLQFRALGVLRSFPQQKSYPDSLALAVLKHVDNNLAIPVESMSALSALPADRITLEDSLFEFICKQFEPNHKPNIPGMAISALEKNKMVPNQLIRITELFAFISPVDMPRMVSLFEKSKEDAVGLALVKALQDPKVRPAVRLEQVKPILDKYGPKVQEAANPLYAAFAADRAGETAKLETLLKELPAGDVRRGQVVFHSQKAACATCH
jgi:hypothetical protein